MNKANNKRGTIGGERQESPDCKGSEIKPKSKKRKKNKSIRKK